MFVYPKDRFNFHFFPLGERVETSIFCSSTIKSARSISESPICITPYAESIKDIQSENQTIENVRFDLKFIWNNHGSIFPFLLVDKYKY